MNPATGETNWRPALRSSRKVTSSAMFLAAFMVGLVVSIVSKVAFLGDSHVKVVAGTIAATKEVVDKGDVVGLPSESPSDEFFYLESTPKPRTLDDLLALAHPPHGTFVRLRLREALAGATADQLESWLEQGKPAASGPGMSHAWKWDLVREALEEQAARVDPMILVRTLTAKLEDTAHGSGYARGVGVLARLPTDYAKQVMENLPDRFRFEFIVDHVGSMSAESEGQLALLRERFLSEHASAEERASLQEVLPAEAPLRVPTSFEIPDDPAAAQSFIDALPETQQTETWRRYYMKLFELGLTPQESLAQAQRAGLSERDASVQTKFYSALARRWASSDPDAALDWARSLGDNARTEAMQAVVDALSRSDPVAAMDCIKALPAEAHRAETVSSIAANLSDFDPATALDWMWSQPQQEELRGLISLLGSRWIAKDPAGAAAWLAQHPEAVEAKGAGSLS